MSDSGRDPLLPPGADEDESRRVFLRRLARGMAYSAPIISSFAAPPAAAAQTSGTMMLTICDYFPVLCRWLGGNQSTTFTLNQAQPGGAAAPPSPQLPEAPWSAPPPWSPDAKK